MRRGIPRRSRNTGQRLSRAIIRKHRASKKRIPKKRTVLFGGKRPVVVDSIARGKRIGGNNEGNVFEVNVQVSRGGKKHTLRLVEKEFHDKPFNPAELPYGDPQEQHKIMHEILKLNAKHNLGLHIAPTIRLKKIEGKKPSLIMTRLENIETGFVPLDESKKISMQQRREKNILRDHGYSLGYDVWTVTKDPKTGKHTAWIADFGNVRRISDIERIWQESQPVKKKKR